MIDITYDPCPSKGTRQDLSLALHIARFTTLGVWLVTGACGLAASVGLAEIAVKFGGYYLHECFWDWLAFTGRRNPFPFSGLFPKMRNNHVNNLT